MHTNKEIQMHTRKKYKCKYFFSVKQILFVMEYFNFEYAIFWEKTGSICEGGYGGNWSRGEFMAQS